MPASTSLPPFCPDSFKPRTASQWTIWVLSAVKKINLRCLFLQVESLAKICHPAASDCVLELAWKVSSLNGRASSFGLNKPGHTKFRGRFGITFFGSFTCALLQSRQPTHEAMTCGWNSHWVPGLTTGTWKFRDSAPAACAVACIAQRSLPPASDVPATSSLGDPLQFLLFQPPQLTSQSTSHPQQQLLAHQSLTQ